MEFEKKIMEISDEALAQVSGGVDDRSGCYRDPNTPDKNPQETQKAQEQSTPNRELTEEEKAKLQELLKAFQSKK